MRHETQLATLTGGRTRETGEADRGGQDRGTGRRGGAERASDPEPPTPSPPMRGDNQLAAHRPHHTRLDPMLPLAVTANTDNT